MTYTLRPATLSVLALLRELERGRIEHLNGSAGYNMQDGVASHDPANMRAARLGATPLGRAARHSGVDE